MASSSASEIDIAGADIRIAQSHLLAGEPHTALELGHSCSSMRWRDEPRTLRRRRSSSADRRLAALGRADEAHAAYVEAMHVLTGAGADRPVAQLWFELADLMEEAGDFDGAREAYRSAAATSGLTSRRRATRQIPAGL